MTSFKMQGGLISTPFARIDVLSKKKLEINLRKLCLLNLQCHLESGDMSNISALGHRFFKLQQN